ncbi:MAG: 5-carboxymethyl-2-hydroxymuconate isomerase, partial [Pseudomonadota bacterium]|nr:5-carboxymethyl-2-hydroxymuconate isomerase [Pseudomonadota bacterium]
MRLVTYDYNHRLRLGVIAGDTVIMPSLTGEWPQELDSVLGVIEGGSELLTGLRRLIADAPAAAHVAVECARLAAPIPRPRKNVMC